MVSLAIVVSGLYLVAWFLGKGRKFEDAKSESEKARHIAWHFTAKT